VRCGTARPDARTYAMYQVAAALTEYQDAAALRRHPRQGVPIKLQSHSVASPPRHATHLRRCPNSGAPADRHGAVPCRIHMLQQRPGGQPAPVFCSLLFWGYPVAPPSLFRPQSAYTVHALFRSFCSCTLSASVAVCVLSLPWEEEGKQRNGVNALPAPC
jgi:hypothetical protein